MQQDVGIVLLCSSKLPDDVIPVPKHVEVNKCHELYFILLRTCVGWCINCKNLHRVSNIKSEGKVLLKYLVVIWCKTSKLISDKYGGSMWTGFYVAVQEDHWLRILEILMKILVFIPKNIH